MSDEEYELAHLRSWQDARWAGEEDALGGKPYEPMRVPWKEHRDALSAEAYMSGWVDAICQRSPVRRFFFRLGHAIANRATRIGADRRGLKVRS